MVVLLLTGAVVTGLLNTGGIDLFCSFTTGSVKTNMKHIGNHDMHFITSFNNIKAACPEMLRKLSFH